MNPGGSIKDRPARRILEEALNAGQVDRKTVVVESSSGNMGVGLAQACLYYGLRFICVVDAKTARQNIKILKAYGAEIERVMEPDPDTGEYLTARLNRVEAIRDSLEKSFWPNQYDNPGNPASHYATTIQEVLDCLGGELDYLFAATSTCGTVRGCGEYIRDNGSDCKIIAVDAVGSQIFGGCPVDRNIPGIGAGIRPGHLDLELIHDYVYVSDSDCIMGCRRLLEREAILAGGSSGGVIAAVERFADRIEAGAICVVILPDRGERYLDTIYDDGWVTDLCGEIPAHGTAERIQAEDEQNAASPFPGGARAVADPG